MGGSETRIATDAAPQPDTNKDACRLGASLKDLGRKWFAFSKMGMGGLDFSNFHNIFLTGIPQLAVSS
ncbi:MAG: hypothetical protein FWC04_06405 [Chitinispirillia bacterium]|nr:hypothetical protein [Chitinispirillia bacterium]